MNESGIPKRRALGRGLEELFTSEVLDYNTVEEKIVKETPKDEIVMVKLDDLRANPYQPRKVFDQEALQELSNSIKEHGVFQQHRTGFTHLPRASGCKGYCRRNETQLDTSVVGICRRRPGHDGYQTA